MIMQVQQRQDEIRSRRQRRNLARTARFRRQIFRYLLLFALLSGGIATFRYVAWPLPQEQIVVQGNRVVSYQQVNDALAGSNGKLLYRINPQLLEQQVKNLQAVKYAFVRRHLLPTPHLVVDVLEEVPWACLTTGPDLAPHAVIAESGRIIPIDRFPAVTQPTLQIYGLPNLQLNSAQVAQWASWVNYISAQTGRPVNAIDMRNPGEVAIADGELFLKVGNPDSTLTKRLGRLASVMPVMTDLPGSVQYIDLSLDNNIPLKVAAKSRDAEVKPKPETL